MIVNKYQSEIEKLLQKSEQDLSKELLKAYQSVYNEVNDQVRQLVEDTEKLNFSQKMQAERLKLIKQQLQINIDELQSVNDRKIYNFLDTTARLGYNELFYEFEQTTGIPISFSMLDTKTIETIIQTPVASHKLSTRLQGNVTKLKQSINQELTRGFAKGLGYNKMAQRISNVGDAKYRRAMVIARTEGGRVSAITRQKSQDDITAKGVEVEKQWSAALDMKTRSDHAQLDGTTIPIKEYFKVSGYKALQPHMFCEASEDCNCRCRTISVIKGYEHKLRRDNETHEVGAYQNYQEWLDGKENVVNSSKKAYTGIKDIEAIKGYMSSIDFSSASHTDITALGSLVNSKFDVSSKLGDKAALKKIFSNFREIGGAVPKDGWAKGSAKDSKSRLAEAFSFYPKEWAEYAHANGKTIYSKNVERGFFSDVGLKGRTWRSGIVDNGVSIMLSKNSNTVSFHEIGHYVEHFNPDALRLSKEFLAYRTKGEQEEPIKNMLYWYGVNEKTKKDNFITPYIGKTYSNATEILSVGLESLFEPGKGQLFSQTSRRSEVVMKKISDDTEYLNFIIGMILKG